MTARLKKQLAKLPTNPGVYLFRDNGRNILYVGKAKNLKNRVRSYFLRTRDLTEEKQHLVGQINDIETILTNSETEALLLEATLIHRHQPPHNIVLRDEKSFLYVRIKLGDPYPAVELVRGIQKDKARYFGPYTSAGSIRSTMHHIRKVFPYRRCSNPADKPCFEAQLGRCAGHDLIPTSRREYAQLIQGLIRFLEGRGQDVIRGLRVSMRTASSERKYEVAAMYRDRLRAIARILSEQQVISTHNENEDYISLLRTDTLARVNLFRVRSGKLIGREIFAVRNLPGSTDADVLGAFVEQYYTQSADHPKTVIIPFAISDQVRIGNAFQLQFIVPQRGRKKKLLGLGLKNAESALAKARPSAQLETSRRHQTLTELARVLKLPRPPRRIEAYDISNIQGVYPVGSMVVVEDGAPKKSEYRKFAIRTVRGPDDFHMLAEMLKRRLMHPDWPTPDLIVLDGGKPQLAVVQSVVSAQVPMIALAKREEEIYLPKRSAPLILPRNSNALFMLQRIRDEAHRFAIGYYRKKHESGGLRSSLDEISGIGPKTKKLLLKEFGSVKAIKAASLSDLGKVVGQAKAEKLRALFGE